MDDESQNNEGELGVDEGKEREGDETREKEISENEEAENEEKNKKRKIEGVEGCDSKNIGFWEDRWVGDMPLQNLFARIFTNSKQKGEVIGNMGEWRDG